MDVRFEWRIQDVERKADQACREIYKVDTLSCSVNRLECSVRNISSDTSGIWNEINAIKDKQFEIERRLELLESNA